MVSGEKSYSIRLCVLTVFMFGAWVVAAEGWVTLIAIVWLAYPALVSHTILRRGRASLRW